MDLLEELKDYANKNCVPIIRDESALFLQEKVKEYSPKQILEIGTAIGYSGCLMLNACQDSHLTTIEINEKSHQKAKQTFAENGLAERVDAILGDALLVLQDLEKQNKKFDFIFLDGPKGQYIKYLPILLGLLTKNGIIFADNVYLHGLVKSTQKIAHKHRTMVNNMRAYLDAVTHNNNLETTIYDIEDGIAVTKLL